MKLVVDVNIIMASLIRQSVTAELLVRDDLELFSPDYALDEIIQNRDIILEKTNRPREEFAIFIDILQRRVKWVPQKEWEQFIPAAREICPDMKDIPFFALALAISAPIWSNDKELKEKQSTVNVVFTHELWAEILSKSEGVK